MVAKEIFWTESARDQLRQIFVRIAGASPTRARSWVDHLLQQVALLREEYAYGTPEPLLRMERDKHCFKMIGFYKVLYAEKEEFIFIKAVYHKRQNPA